MTPAALRRAEALMLWAPCAPRFVGEALAGIVARPSLGADVRAALEAWRSGLEATGTSEGWCLFPAVADGGPAGLLGGLCGVTAVDLGMPPPPGAEALVAAAPDVAAHPVVGSRAGGAWVRGRPPTAAGPVRDRSATAAVWLALRARDRGLALPDGLVVSADLQPGPNGEPRLGAVRDGFRKAAIVARERPGARLLLCLEPGEDLPAGAEALPVGAPVTELERRVWGEAVGRDRADVQRALRSGQEAFAAHDYRLADTYFEEVLRVAGAEEGPARFEAALRRAAIATYTGEVQRAETWFRVASTVSLPQTAAARLVVDRLVSLVDIHLDAFEPRSTRRLLGERLARHVLSDDHPDALERVQLLGAWRRLHLLEGNLDAALDVQRRVVAIADGAERPRALLDLAWVQMRRGALDDAVRNLVDARHTLERAEPIYRLQTVGFLTWYTARLELAGRSEPALADLLDPRAIDALLAAPALQAPPRWRLRAVRAARSGDAAAVAEHVAACTPFQRWHTGVYLLDVPDGEPFGREALVGAAVNLAEMPPLAEARARLARGPDRQAAAVVGRHTAY